MNILVIIVSFIISLAITVIVSKKWKSKFLGFLCSFMFLFLIGVFFSHLWRKHIGNGDYTLLDFSGKTIYQYAAFSLILELIISIFICILTNLLSERKISAVLTIGKNRYHFIPFYSVQCLIIICGSICFLLSVADALMPQYGLWSVENTNIDQKRYREHIATVENLNEKGYPLWSLYDVDFDSNTLNNHDEDTKTILILGDSFIWGDGSSNVNLLWWRQLQLNIKAKGYDNCRIVAVGANGASTEDELRWLKDTTMIDDINPDLILIGYVTNDAQHIENGERDPKIYTYNDYSESGIVHFLSYFFPNITYYINNELQIRESKRIFFDEVTGFPYDIWEKEIISGEYGERYEKIAIKPLSDYLKTSNIPCTVIMTPSTPEKTYQEMYDIIIPMLERNGIKVYNPLDEFCDAAETNTDYCKWINPVNGHPGIAMNKLISDYVFDVILADYSFALGEESVIERNDLHFSINDWYPHQVMPSINDNRVSFNYDSQWPKDHFLYLPQKNGCIKICFETPIALEKLRIFDSENMSVKDANIWVSYIGDNGYESDKLLKLKEERGTFICSAPKVTALLIQMEKEMGQFSIELN